jgi:hypothetical protein
MYVYIYIYVYMYIYNYIIIYICILDLYKFGYEYIELVVTIVTGRLPWSGNKPTFRKNGAQT